MRSSVIECVLDRCIMHQVAPSHSLLVTSGFFWTIINIKLIEKLIWSRSLFWWTMLRGNIAPCLFAIEELICIERCFCALNFFPRDVEPTNAAVDLQLKWINYIGSQKLYNNYNIIIKNKENKKGNTELPTSRRFFQIDKVSLQCNEMLGQKKCSRKGYFTLRLSPFHFFNLRCK